MPLIKSTFPRALWAILYKEGLCEFRIRYAVSALSMFALVTLSSVSMTIAGTTLAPELAAVLLWIILFFCAMAGLSRVFVQEYETGTIFLLRLYASAQAIVFGKLLFNIIMLAALTIFIIPLFIIFLNIEIPFVFTFSILLLLGDIGIAAAATITAAIVAKTQGKSALFTVLTFPILLPQFLAVISATAKVLNHTVPQVTELIFIAGYDLVLCIAGRFSMLFFISYRPQKAWGIWFVSPSSIFQWRGCPSLLSSFQQGAPFSICVPATSYMIGGELLLHV
ncbi:MAG: cytochrome c-type biosis protein CcmB [Anaerospora sp.]|nr:cytochrome c-type biosis protein CcmB [Anaerospora sp.]